MADEISPYWVERGYYILHDHDLTGGMIVSWFGKSPYGQNTQLNDIDIAIVEKTSERILALIEIEETTDKPKTLLGDVFGILTGQYVSYGNEHPLIVDEHSGLFVFGFVAEKSRLAHEDRFSYLREQIKRVNFNDKTGNAKVENIEIKAFSSAEELREMLTAGIVKKHQEIER